MEPGFKRDPNSLERFLQPHLAFRQYLNTVPQVDAILVRTLKLLLVGENFRSPSFKRNHSKETETAAADSYVMKHAGSSIKMASDQG